MRTVNTHVAAPLLDWVTESVDTTAVFRKGGARLRRWLRHRLCGVVNGGHELYRAHSESKLFQQCLLCGYETHGWTIDRRDRC